VQRLGGAHLIHSCRSQSLRKYDTLVSYHLVYSHFIVSDWLVTALPGSFATKDFLAKANAIAAEAFAAASMLTLSNSNELMKIRAIQALAATALRDPEAHLTSVMTTLSGVVIKDQISPCKSAALKCIAKLVAQHADAAVLSSTNVRIPMLINFARLFLTAVLFPHRRP
jgi:hypothetical protein